MPGLDLPSAIAASTPRSRGRQRGTAGSPGCGAAEHPGDNLGIERRAAGRDVPRSASMKARHVADPFLEQVAHALGAIADEVDRRRARRTGTGSAPRCRAGGSAARVAATESVVLVPGRHADVEDRDVGAVGERAAQQVVGVSGLGRRRRVPPRPGCARSPRAAARRPRRQPRAGLTTVAGTPSPAFEERRREVSASSSFGRSARAPAGRAAAAGRRPRMRRRGRPAGGAAARPAARARANPSPSGRPTSTRATSGSSSTARRTASATVPASPITMCPQPVRTRVARPRKAESSSTTSTELAHPLMVPASHRRGGRASPLRYRASGPVRRAPPTGSLGSVPGPSAPTRGGPVATITVGQENSTAVELSYEDHGSGPGRAAARVAGRQPVVGAAAAPAARRRLPGRRLRPPRLRPVKPAHRRATTSTRSRPTSTPS